MIRIIVPCCPVGKARPRLGRGHVYTPKKTKDYERAIQMEALKHGRPLLQGPVSIHVIAGFQPPKSWSRVKREMALSGDSWHMVKPDADNVLKLVCDALTGIIWIDDKQVARMTIEKIYVPMASLSIAVKEL